MNKIISAFFAAFLSSPALADAPKVVADIAPLHSLVAQVMGDIGAPDLLVEPIATPHSYALRASQAASLERADVVFLTSYSLTPWLHGPVTSLARSALVLELMQTEEAVHYDFREGEDGHAHEHDHGHEGGDVHADDEFLDPHGWLDPENAKRWLAHIAQTLAAADPDNGAQYSDNAQAAVREIEQLQADLKDVLAPVTTQPYMVLHDAFQYFDRRFELTFAGAIALGDASAPSPARLTHAREDLVVQGVSCIFTEPQQSDRLVQVVMEGTDVKTGVLDPIGATLAPGPDQYSQLLQGLADSFAKCLAN